MERVRLYCVHILDQPFHSNVSQLEPNFTLYCGPPIAAPEFLASLWCLNFSPSRFQCTRWEWYFKEIWFCIIWTSWRCRKVCQRAQWQRIWWQKALLWPCSEKSRAPSRIEKQIRKVEARKNPTLSRSQSLRQKFGWLNHRWYSSWTLFTVWNHHISQGMISQSMCKFGYIVRFLSGMFHHVE